MKLRRISIALLLGLLILAPVLKSGGAGAGTTYYVDTASSGGDGTTTATSGAHAAFATIAAVNGATFAAGDTISFNKGNVWREQLTVPRSGSAGLPLTFNSYGSGADPIIYGSKLASASGDWTNDGGTSEYWGDNFETNDFSKWTSETDVPSHLATSSTQAHAGTYAARFLSDSGSACYLNKTLAAAQSNFTASFWLYTNDTTNDSSNWDFVDADTDAAYSIHFRYSGGNHQVSVTRYNDAGTGVATAYYTYQAGATPGWHQIEVVLVTATAGGNNGSVKLKVDGVSKETLSDIDNDVKGIVKYIKYVGWYDSGSDRYIDDFQILVAAASNLWYTAATATPAVVWKNGARLTYTATKTDLNTDTGVTKWYWDSGNSRVYVYGGGSAPTASFEIAQRDYCIRGVDKSYITIDGIKCEYANLIGISSAVSGAAATNWTVQNCAVTGCWQGGIWGIGSATYSVNYFNANTNTLTDIGGRPTNYWDGSSIRVEYADYLSLHTNNITLSGFAGQHNYTAGIAFFFSKTTGDTNSAIYSNTITGTNTAASLACGIALGSIYYADIYMNDISGSYAMGIWTDETGGGTNDGSFYTKYYRNKIVMTGANVQWGFNLEVSKSDQVYYNIIDVAGAADPWGFYMGVGIAADGYVTNTVVYNNTIKTANGGIAVQLGNAAYGTRKVKSVTVTNNIISGNTTGGALLTTANNGSGTDGHVFDYNSYYDAGSPAWYINWFGTHYASAALFHAGVSSQETHGITGNQLLTAYVPAPNSPVRNAGTNVGLTTDYAGKAVHNPPSIGAYEFPRHGSLLFLLGIR